ncbi:hypothetical protein TVAG_353970 [Trichomonas vaginalis G3]|uniref:Right handed beta helix domain-containing protein n=1 Tax=Trichomonas vaginalis (strain ATCC PRA-98 / G3) TaxID=412133 RepID=A2FH17_TRIV3|nr:hypothetical protein TVAGG3_0427850 [Trichomonas vaginalis G3]EAX95785.1 hypothetical protein TVAG_353970 [Trichomonas vaginalis G3]KAI5536545.1 hypothetical protein TVAGG3_0427850 [Trichomonas vaginalis G3]|eukprot:XP_001308715.1 hypothetical protein [Trichomonas vaginalis G3]
MKNAKRFDWSDYFGDKVKLDHTQNGAPLYDNTSSNNYYVSNCEFEECTENGAIYIKSNNEIYTLIEDSAFRKCSSTYQGGSVYYGCHELGHFVQQQNSYSESKAENSYMAFCQLVKSSSTNENYAFDISVSQCGESESKGYKTSWISFGDIQIKNNNITYNKCIFHSSINSVLQGKSGYCNFSTFRENNQTREGSLAFGSHYKSNIQTVSYCNIIGNKCGTNKDQALFGCTYDTKVDHCVFLNNTAGCMFGIIDKDCTLTISDSCIQSKSISGSGTVTFEREDQIYSDLNQIISFYTELCFIPKQKQTTVSLSAFSRFAETSPSLLYSSKR